MRALQGLLAALLVSLLAYTVITIANEIQPVLCGSALKNIGTTCGTMGRVPKIGAAMASVSSRRST